MTKKKIELSELATPFPMDAVQWRAQQVFKDKDGNTKALALAYIDARDVMRRLDEVCGPENWQDRHRVEEKRVICEIGIRVGDDWVWKSDGAGDTQVEAEKGGLSDAFKRCAVMWGIGRYLYDMDTPWVPCVANESNGKFYWKRWAEDPWQHVRAANAAMSYAWNYAVKLSSCKSKSAFIELKGDEDHKKRLARLEAAYPDLREHIHNIGAAVAERLEISGKSIDNKEAA